LNVKDPKYALTHISGRDVLISSTVAVCEESFWFDG
jgi:hypothetical protein